jgi:hypothetical protein
MNDEKVSQNVKGAWQRKYRENQHKEFVDKEKARERAELPEGSRKINGRIYTYHDSCKKRSDAEEKAKTLNGSNLTHIEKTTRGWSIYLLPF